MLYELHPVGAINIEDFHNEETLKLGFFSKEEIQALDTVSAKHRLMLDEYFTNHFEIGH